MRGGRPHIEERAPGAGRAGELEQRAQQAPAEPLALQLRIDADVQHVRLVGGNAEHAVAEDAAVLVQDPRRVIGAQAVAEDAVGPRERVCAMLDLRSEEQTSELQSLMRISYAVFCLKKKKSNNK